MSPRKKFFLCGFLDIRGNEVADRAAKEALDKEPTDNLMPFADLRPLTAKYIHQVWQKEWDEAVIAFNKLREILSKLLDKLLSFCKTRKEDTVLSRLHTGHSYLIHPCNFEKKKKKKKKKRKTSCLCCM